MSSLRFLRSFLMVAECGSLVAAADRLGLTQAAVSLQMRSLEREFGWPLFDRGGRGLTLNVWGRRLRPQAERLLGLYEEMRADFAGNEDGLVGEVAVGAVVSAMGALARAVAELKRDHPRLEVRLVTGKSGELVEQVVDGRLDAAITVELPGRTPARLDWTPLYAEPLVLLAGRAAAGRSLEDLLRHEPFLRFDRATPTGLLIDRALVARKIEVKEFLDLNSIETIVELVRQDVGVSLLPLLKGTNWQRDARLRLIALNRDEDIRTIGLIERHGQGQSTLVQAIRGAIG
ncbi:MAG TPA: LysR family transcriptional regulator [Aliidongia sp.]|uniref:LysR family transcriptional regulator n=1 Tax=Aliidongia sp. TaxID=1914230 RepID=UPI002DDD4582|nr:LysR family transcriptional regulator [Aliidongia sp.]HEV2678577.1 LysR family transcriptional regulator [Aliidongia sp.]